MNSGRPTSTTPRPRPPGPRWIMAGFGLLFLSWLVFMGYYVWKVTRQPPPAEPPPVHPVTDPPQTPAGR